MWRCKTPFVIYFSLCFIKYIWQTFLIFWPQGTWRTKLGFDWMLQCCWHWSCFPFELWECVVASWWITLTSPSFNARQCCYNDHTVPTKNAASLLERPAFPLTKSVTMQKLDKIWTLFILWRWKTGQKGWRKGGGSWKWSFTITRGWCQEGFQSGRREKASTQGIIGTKHSWAKLFLNGVTLSKGSWPNSLSESNTMSPKLNATGGSHRGPLWSGWDFQLAVPTRLQTLSFRHSRHNHKICQHCHKVISIFFSGQFLSFQSGSLSHHRKRQKCER